MNTDLISREALKEHKFVGNKFVQIGGRTNGKTLENINKAYQKGWNDAIDAIINNAPTVDLDEFYGKAFRNGEENALKIRDLELRAQGEWIFGSTLGHGWMKCSNCCVSQSGQTLCWSYCPNCGACMQKGGAE